MGSRILYYLVILPISIMPYPLLYLHSDFAFLMIYHVVGYRKKVVLKNIQNSFPEKSPEEHKKIMRKFYRHFCDLILESLKGFTISKKQLDKRFKLRNPEVSDAFFEKGQNLVMVGGHYNNWEILALGIGYQMKHLPIGIYKPLHNKYFDEKMKKTRQRFGLKLCPMKETKAHFMGDHGKPNGIIFAIDQTPSNTKKCHWMEFLNQDTPVFFGAEKYAREFDRPVIFCTIHKVKRGHYEAELEVITDTPNELPHGAITEMNTQRLEKDIIEKPEYWLWSHRRWKHKRPEGI